MALLDCVAPLRQGTWAGLSALKREDHGSSRWAPQKRVADAAARADLQLGRDLAADLVS